MSGSEHESSGVLPQPFQLTMTNWLEAYQRAASQTQQRQAQQPQQITEKEEVKKEEPMSDMQGGWRFEGKEKPVSPKICKKCQLIKNAAPEDLDRSNWCDSCLEGKPGPGSTPSNWNPPENFSENSPETIF